MKKIGYLLIVVLTCFLITGCSSDGDDKIYKKIDGSNNVSDEVKDVTTDGFNVLDNVKKLNQYKYTFTYDKDSNNYVFNSIELVK